jgi:hypothetical protein
MRASCKSPVRRLVRSRLSGDASWAAVRAPPHFEGRPQRSSTPLSSRKEVGGLTVVVAHPLLEDVSSEEAAKHLLPDIFGEDALSESGERKASNLYEAPEAEVEHVERETESYLAWIIVLGFVTYAIVLYWAAKCNRMGGDPSIKFSLLRGFVIRCYR